MSSIMATHLMIKKTMTNQQDNTKNIILIATMILPLISIGLTVPNVQAFDGDFLDDADHDGILDVNDNCVDDANFDQADTDGDGSGDACDLVLNVDGDIKPGDVFVIDSAHGRSSGSCPARSCPCNVGLNRFSPSGSCMLSLFKQSSRGMLLGPPPTPPT